MSTQKFTIDYDECEIELLVDNDPKYLAIYQDFLDFFVWDYDKSADVRVEAVKKISVEILRQSVNYWTVEGMVKEFDDKEGFPRLCGADGITLVMYSCNNIIMENQLEIKQQIKDMGFVNHTNI